MTSRAGRLWRQLIREVGSSRESSGGVEVAAEAVDGAEVAFHVGFFGDAEDRGGFGDGELLKIAEDEDLAVARGKFAEGGLDAFLLFFAHEALAGARAGGDEALGKVEGRGVGGLERLFAVDGAFLSGKVVLFELHELLAGELTEPRVEGERLFFGEVGETLGGLDQGVLDHVGRVGAAGEAAVEVDRNHAFESVSMEAEQGLDCGVFAGGDACEQPVDGVVIDRHAVALRNRP